jgi:hypothetical protein
MEKEGTHVAAWIVSAVIGGVLWAAAVAHASPLYSGTITGIFSAPILSGFEIETDGSVTFFDNSATAVISGVGTSTFNWGTLDGSFFPDHSTLQFSGVDFTSKAPDEVFKLGTLTYTNGTSFVDTTAFGITLTIGVANFNVAIDPAVAQLAILVTVNGGVDPFRDADFISFDVLPLTFHVFEGATATADVFGYIHGDPQVVISGISLPLDQPGFLASVPQPGTYVLVLAGLALLGFVARRKRMAA